MSKTFTAPGTDFPALPAISLTTPDDWEAGPAAGVVMAVIGPALPQTFRANVVVSAERLAGKPELRELADGVRARVATFEDVHPVLDRMVEVGGRPGHVLQFTYRQAEAGTLAQSILTVPVQHEGVTDLYEVVGSLGGDRIDQDAATVTAVLQSVAIG